MGYAINTTAPSLRAVDSADDLLAGEVYQDQIPTPWPPLPDLTTAIAAQIAEIDADCQATIYAGFTSSALGEAYSYPAKTKDQQNLTASVLDSVMPGISATWTTPFWCESAAGEWAYVLHTAAQIQQVGQDGKVSILACMAKKQALEASINALATQDGATAADAQAIVWVYP